MVSSARHCKRQGMAGSRFDLDQQIAAAYVRAQENELGRRPEGAAQFLAHRLKVPAVPQVDLAAQALEREIGTGRKSARLFDHRFDIGQRLARLRDHVAFMQGAVSDDTCSARYEQYGIAAQSDHVGSGKGWAARPVLGGITIGADLARILDEDRRSGITPRQETHGKRSGLEADCGCCRHAFRDPLATREKTILPPHVELAVSLHAMGMAIDVGKIVPETENRREAQRLRQFEYRTVCEFRSCLQRRFSAIAHDGRIEFDFGKLDRSEQDGFIMAVLHTCMRAVYELAAGMPCLACRDWISGRIEASHRHLDQRHVRYRVSDSISVPGKT